MDADREDSTEAPLDLPDRSLPVAPRKSVFLHILYMVAGMGIARVFGMVSTFLVANILGPSRLGIFSTIRLIYVYGTINHLGVLEAYRKEVPRLHGRGNEEGAQQIENLSLGMAWASSGVLVLVGTMILLAWVILAPTSQVSQFALPSFFMLITVAGATVGTLYFDRFTVRHHFEQAGMLRGVRGAAYLLFFPLGAWFGGVTGVCLGFLLAEWSITLISFQLGKGLCPPVRPLLDIQRIIQLIRIGFPITLVWWTYMMGTTFDRIVTVSLLGSEATGLYFMGITLASVLQMLPESLSRVFNPRLNEKMGATSDPIPVAKVVWEPATTLSWILPFAFSSCVFFIDPLYRTGFPKYIPAVLSSQILVVGASLLALVPLGTDFLVSIHHQARLAWVVILSLALNVTANMFLISLGYGIVGVASVSVITNGMVACYPWSRVCRLVNPGKGLLTLFQLGTGFIVSNGLLWPIERGWMIPFHSGWGGGFFKAATFSMGYLFLMSRIPWCHIWMVRDMERFRIEMGMRWRGSRGKPENSINGDTH